MDMAKKKTMKRASISKSERRAKVMHPRAGYRADGYRYEKGGKITK